jgi:hypothetical protein
VALRWHDAYHTQIGMRINVLIASTTCNLLSVWGVPFVGMRRLSASVTRPIVSLLCQCVERTNASSSRFTGWSLVSLGNQTHICEDDGECARIHMEAMNIQLCTALTNQFIGISNTLDLMDWLCKPFYSKRRVF